MRHSKKAVSVLLAGMLAFSSVSVVPMTAFADDSETQQDQYVDGLDEVTQSNDLAIVAQGVIDDDDVLSARQRAAEIIWQMARILDENGQPGAASTVRSLGSKLLTDHSVGKIKGHLDDAISRAREALPDYPWDDQDFLSEEFLSFAPVDDDYPSGDFNLPYDRDPFLHDSGNGRNWPRYNYGYNEYWYEGYRPSRNQYYNSYGYYSPYGYNYSYNGRYRDYDYEASTETKTVPIYRLVNPANGDHVFNASSAVRDKLIGEGWVSEGTAWSALENSSKPVYQLRNTVTGRYHYTTNATERDNLVADRWENDGVAFYASESGATAVYRVLNPVNGSHFFTSNASERNQLLQTGWGDEGVAFYVGK